MTNADLTPSADPLTGERFRDTDLANAARFVADHKADVLYVADWRRWCVFDGRRWMVDSSGAVVSGLAHRTLRRMAAEAAEKIGAAARRSAKAGCEAEEAATEKAMTAAKHELMWAKRSQDAKRVAVAYATNAKVYPVADIVRGVVDIYYRKPFTIPALESVAVRPEVLDKYVGVYASPDAPAKATITRDGATLFFKPPGAQSAVPLEATAENRFQIEGVAVIEFEKGRMTVKRRGGERVFTKEE